MATLTRKSKSMEVLSKEEMITYHKGNNIPTSHIQLHDPDSVTAAVNIFRVSRGFSTLYLFVLTFTPAYFTDQPLIGNFMAANVCFRIYVGT